MLLNINFIQTNHLIFQLSVDMEKEVANTCVQTPTRVLFARAEMATSWQIMGKDAQVLYSQVSELKVSMKLVFLINNLHLSDIISINQMFPLFALMRCYLLLS